MFFDYFTRDNFTWRRTTGHNAYDPESLLTQAEIDAGLDYTDARVWPDKATYERAVSGEIPVDQIPVIAPRVRTPYKVVHRHVGVENVAEQHFTRAQAEEKARDLDAAYLAKGYPSGVWIAIPATWTWSSFTRRWSAPSKTRSATV